MRWLVLALLLVLPAASFAQDRAWQLETHVTDAATGAVLTNPTERMRIYCGEVLGSDTSLNEELAYPGAGHFYFVGPEGVLGAYDPTSNSEQTVAMFSQGVEVTLPPFYFDDMGGEGWVSRVPFDHPVVALIKQGGDVGIIPQLAFETYLYADKFAQGVTAMMAHCTRDTAQAPSPQAKAVDPALFGLIQTQAFALCQAAYDLPQSAYQVADVTGDGVDDVIVNYGQLTCTEGLFAKLPVSLACAGEMCRHDIYTAQSATPIELMGMRLIPAPDQLGDIHLVMDVPSCAAMGRDADCKVRMRWQAQTFGTVGLE